MRAVEVRCFPVADLHDVMAHVLSLSKVRNLDIFIGTEGIVRGNFRRIDLLEFASVLQEKVRDRRATREQEQCEQNRNVRPG